jgi:hypothetical protein
LHKVFCKNVKFRKHTKKDVIRNRRGTKIERDKKVEWKSILIFYTNHDKDTAKADGATQVIGMKYAG